MFTQEWLFQFSVLGGQGSDLSASPESRVLSLQRELATARLSYTDRHPEIVRLTDELAQIDLEALQPREMTLHRLKLHRT